MLPNKTWWISLPLAFCPSIKLHEIPTTEDGNASAQPQTIHLKFEDRLQPEIFDLPLDIGWNVVKKDTFSFPG